MPSTPRTTARAAAGPRTEASRPAAPAPGPSTPALSGDSSSENQPQQDDAATAVSLFCAGAGTPQPHPVSPAVFASAFLTQHASASRGAGPPQHADAACPATAFTSAISVSFF